MLPGPLPVTRRGFVKCLLDWVVFEKGKAKPLERRALDPFLAIAGRGGLRPPGAQKIVEIRRINTGIRVFITWIRGGGLLFEQCIGRVGGSGGSRKSPLRAQRLLQLGRIFVNISNFLTEM